MDLNFRLSAKFFRRSKLLDTLEVPTMSEVKAATGASLAELIFEETHGDLREDFGLIPSLKGPEGDLWVSPSDLLVGKVCLKPPLTQKHVKALTHEGICEIGYLIEEKFRNEHRIEMEKALHEKEEYMTKLFEIEKEILIREIEERMKIEFENESQKSRREYEIQICSILYECGTQVETLEKEMAETMEATNERWRQELEDQIQMTTKRLTEQFLNELQHQEETLAECFYTKIQCLKEKHKFQIAFERTKYKEMLLQLRHKLHCENIASLMYLLCKERHNCQKEKQKILDTCRVSNKKKDLKIHRNNIELKKISREKKDAIKRLNIRERCLLAIIREFRKFIYFALKAVPTQGEFLLNIDKLLKFELVNYCLSEIEEKKKIQNESKEIDEKDKDLNEKILSNVEVEESEKMNEGIQPQDSNELPIFYFNKKMYVREDFRDLMLTDIKIDYHHPLWNTDVEELLKILGKTVETSNQKIKLRSHQSSVHFHLNKFTADPNKKTETPAALLSIPSGSDTMIHKTSSSTNQEFEIEKITLGSSQNNLSKKNNVSKKSPHKTDKKPLPKTQEFGIATPIKSPSKIISARDSLVFHLSAIERQSLAKPISLNDELDGQYLKEPIEDQQDLDSQAVNKHTSKLVLAKDSLEIIKSTINILNEKTEETPTKTPRSPKPSTRPTRKNPKKIKPNRFGEVNLAEQEKSDDVFGDERIKSLIQIMKDKPSLMRLFTSCS